MHEQWKDFVRVDEKEMMKPVDTKVSKKLLADVTKVISNLPEDRKFIRKIQRLVESRQKMFDEDRLDWAMAEHLAYGSLLADCLLYTSPSPRDS